MAGVLIPLLLSTFVWAGPSGPLRLAGEVSSRAEFNAQESPGGFRVEARLNDMRLRVFARVLSSSSRAPAAVRSSLGAAEALEGRVWSRSELESGRVQVVVQAP